MSTEKGIIDLEEISQPTFWQKNRWWLLFTAFLVIAGTAAFTGLVFTGLLLTPWIAIPIICLVGAIVIGIKVGFDNHVGRLSAPEKVGFDNHVGRLSAPEIELDEVKNYRKAANQGDAEAQFNLGSCYEKGEGIRKIGREQ